MRAEQSTRSILLLDTAVPAAEIELTVHIEIPQGGLLGGGDVSTWLRYEPKVPEQVQYELHQALYNGVHTGLATVDYPLPEGGVAVEITRLIVKIPHIETLSAESGPIKQIASSLHTMVTYSVASLWQVLNTWSMPSGGQRINGAPHSQSNISQVE